MQKSGLLPGYAACQGSGIDESTACCVPEVSSAVHDCEQAGRSGCSAAAAPLATASRLSIATADEEDVPTIVLANPSQGAPCVPAKEYPPSPIPEGYARCELFDRACELMETLMECLPACPLHWA